MVITCLAISPSPTPEFHQYEPINENADILPVNHKCPDDCCQQNLVSFEGDGAPMEKEWKMRADHDSKPLSEVPVPGMRAVEISHAIEDVKPQEVELHHGPLKNRERSCYI